MKERKKAPRLSAEAQERKRLWMKSLKAMAKATKQSLTLEQAEILTRGHVQDVRDWLKEIYSAGYQISRTTAEF
jgi:hypothetical protein